MLKFLSICSGIEAASVAFAPLGWEALSFAEIEPFPCAVLAHHYPHVPNLGDLTQWRTWPATLLVQVQLLCGGTPCQAFSVAGLHASLADDRGNLSLIFCELYAHINQLRHAAGLPPALLLWENVPGVLSTHDNAFGCFLAGIAGEGDALQPPGGKWAHAGYVSGPSASVAYRTLDAQYFGLAQRRKRVFVVASADPAFDPAAVLFEFTGLRRDTPPRRETGQTTTHDVAPCLTSGGRGVERPGETRGQDPVVACIPEITQSQDLAATLSANGKAAGSATQQDADQGLLIPVAFGGNNTSGPIDQSPALKANRGCHNPGDFEAGALLVETVHTLRAEGFDASEDGAGRGTPLVPVPSSVVPPLGGLDESPIAFPERLSGTQCASTEDLAPVLQSHNPTAVAFQPGNTGDVVNALQAQSGQSGKGDVVPCVAVKEPESFTCEGFRHKCRHACPQETHAIKALRTMLQEVGEEAFTQWGLGVLDTLQSSAVLQYDMLGETSRLTWASRWEILVNYPLPCAQTSSGRNMRDLWKAQSERCSSSGPQSSKQRSGKPSESLQELPYEIPSQSSILFCLWEACEGIEVLRKALSAFQEMGGPVSNENQSAYPTWKVRRLTPEEAEKLQGFPLGYTILPAKGGRLRKGTDLAQTIAYLRDLGMDEPTATQCAHSPDGPRYKALGNSWAVPCARWIAQRIANHLAQ